MDVIKATADENRVRILMALRNRELCVCQIYGFLGLASSTVSKHMSILKNARLVNSRKEGRWVYYRRALDDATECSRNMLAFLDEHLGYDHIISDDERHIQSIVCTEAPCCKQRED